MKKESGFWIFGLIVALVVVLTSSPRSAAAEGDPSNETESNESLELLVGDVIQIYFPGAPELSGEQRIRRDGKITLAFVGEKEATGYTSSQLEDKLLEWYDDQIVTKEVAVTLISSTFPIYVQGTVLSPGEILSDRRLTALEAVLKAGYDPKQANLKKVRVIRTEGDRRKNYNLDLQAVLEGEDVEPFFLKPSDIVMVSEKFIWTGRR
ncbi:MAG: polysaccharide biosynthesis/export family protein [Verrucomicrobiota bacterium]|nr:polysaccharide biosynthesis/export family protein [Verrucomicrobiota bacterium]